MDFDISKWFDVLKASAWQYLWLFVACAALLLFDSWGMLPVALEATAKQIVEIAAVIFAALWLASISSSLTTVAKIPWGTIRRWLALRAHAKAFCDYIPHMTPESRAVFAQLLHDNHKDFSADEDGGHAATLIGRRFVVPCLTHGQVYDRTDMPFEVPDHIWKVAVAHRNDFPFKRNPMGADAWRVHWATRI